MKEVFHLSSRSWRFMPFLALLMLFSNSISAQCDVNGGTLDGGPFEFCVDGIPDNVSGITLADNEGMNNQWIVTDAEGNILGMPPMPGVVDFDGAGTGVCLIWNVAYIDIDGLVNGNNISDLTGCYDISNAITVVRATDGAACSAGSCDVSSGTLEGGPFEFCVDGTPDMVSGIILDGNTGESNIWVITDATGGILGLPPMPGVVDFDGAGTGVCLIWNVSYDGTLTGAEMGQNLFTDLSGCYSISNAVSVTRVDPPTAGILEGGPFVFCVDGVADMVSDITLTENSGSINQWVITDADANILGLPPMPGVVDFDGAGVGVCLIWNITSNSELGGVTVGNNVSDITGCYALSNSITVYRQAPDGGTVSLADGSTTYAQCAGDIVFDAAHETEADMLSYWYIITDSNDNILAWHNAADGPNLDLRGAPAGECHVWGWSYRGLDDPIVGDHISTLADDGCEAISDNWITVFRETPDGGTVRLVSGGTVYSGTAGDIVIDVQHETTAPYLSYWYIITDADDNILASHNTADGPTLDLSGAPAGECHIWGWNYRGLDDPIMGDNISTLADDFCEDISDNWITVIRQDAACEADGGTLEGGPFVFCVDGVADMVSDITLDGNSGMNSQWVVTDPNGLILGLPPMPGVVDFDAAGAGVCLIYNVSYAEGLVGLEAMGSLATLEGCFGISNPVTVYRQSPDGGTVALANGGTTYSQCAGDIVFDVTHESEADMLSYWYIITDNNDNILAWHNAADGPTLDLSGAPAGECHVWGWSYRGLDDPIVGDHISTLADDGCEAISDNWITVFRETPDGGTVSLVSGGTVYSGTAGNIVIDVQHETTAPYLSYWYIITDADDNILAYHNSADGPTLDLSGAPAGECHIWGWNYKGLDDPIMGDNISTLADDFCEDISDNWITVIRQDAACEAEGGTLEGGPFVFCVDGLADMVSDITLDGNSGMNSQWVVTDPSGLILGLPPMPGVVDFDAAGAGVCLIYNVSYADGLVGLEAMGNLATLEGCFDISNPVTVYRQSPDGGTVSLANGGTMYTGTAGDIVIDVTHETEADMLSYWYIITDADDNILAWHNSADGPTLDLSGAPAGECHIWGWSYRGLDDPIVGENISSLTDDACEAISSNWITVIREELACTTEGGILEGGPFEFCVDGTPDMVSGITLDGNTGSMNQWLITDEEGNILGLPPMPGVVDFDGAGAGICLIWNISSDEALTNVEVGMNVSAIEGCYGLSNAVTVTRIEAMGGTLAGGPFEFCVDGEADFVSDITLEGNSGPNNQWLITDADGNILGLPPMPGVVDFDGAGAGVCFIWNVSYADGLTGLEAGNNVSDLVGCFDISNSIEVVRTGFEGGTLAGGPFEFCVDGTPDMVSGITLDGNTGSMNQWLITDEAGNILGLPPMPGVVDFDEAGAGICLIWNISSDQALTNVEVGMNVSAIEGCYGLSNAITVNRIEAVGGTLAGGPFEFCVDDEADFVSGIVLEGNSGPNDQWIVTDEAGMILGLPPMPGAVDFNEAGPGICLIWNVSYADGLEGLAAGNNVSELVGCFDISNSIVVTRTQTTAGTLEGGPFEFCVDGTPDMVSDITLTGNEGANSQWIVTDVSGNILGLPPMPGAVDFDGAGPGICYISHVSYADGLQGLEMNANTADLEGCFSISNEIEVVRNLAEGGTLEGGPYEFCIDSVGDFVTDLVLTGNTGANSQWVVTDLDGNILGLPGDIAMVDFNEAAVGECLIWHLSYADGLTGAEMGMNANDLVGCFSLSNAISVTRVSEGPLCVTATAEEELFSFINVYPNPTTDLINVDYETQDAIGDVEVGLYNTQGRLMMNQKVAKGNNTMTFDASNIPGGAYLIRFTYENSTTYKRVIVLK